MATLHLKGNDLVSPPSLLFPRCHHGDASKCCTSKHFLGTWEWHNALSFVGFGAKDMFRAQKWKCTLDHTHSLAASTPDSSPMKFSKRLGPLGRVRIHASFTGEISSKYRLEFLQEINSKPGSTKDIEYSRTYIFSIHRIRRATVRTRTYRCSEPI